MEINNTFWDQVKTQLKSKNLDNKSIPIWLDPIEFVEIQGSAEKPRIVLGVPNTLHQFFVIENLQDNIYLEISSVYKMPFDIEFIVTGKSQQSLKPAQTLEEAFEQKANPPAKAGLHDSLNTEHTFSTFVVGKNSEFAHAACFNVARNPGAHDYNPLYIFGPVGMGKTHLLHAAGNYMREHFPHLRIIYISAERFMNECISGIRHSQMDKFRQKYRENADVFLVDDVQFIGKGEAVQAEFFHTVNTFIERRKQVILASDRMPKDILDLEDRNRTRLERGLIADITMPDLETRIAILRYKAERFNLRLPEEVVTYIARISKRSIRELEGNIKKVKMFSELQGLQIDYDLVKKILANHETQNTLTIEEIQRIVAQHYNVKMTDLKSSSRAKPIVVPRQICMFLIKKFLDKSLVDIGKAFGGKDHTTVMNAIERIQFLQAKDQEIFKDIEELENRIHNIIGV